MSNIVVPELGESVVEARIAKWLKKAGDHVEVGDPLVELETEKTNLELSAEKRGVITSIARKEGEDVKIGELLASSMRTAPERRPPAAQATARSAAAAALAALLRRTACARRRATRDAHRARMAKDHEVDLGGVQGTGSAGRVTKQDVQNAIAPPAPTGEPGSHRQAKARSHRPAKPLAPTPRSTGCTARPPDRSHRQRQGIAPKNASA
jgi:2-oxoglutarate dehydrogenase E2 component (dihydrolipoamide succinyltransferase)